MHGVTQPSENHGAVLQNLARGMEDDVIMEPAAPFDNVLMESDDALGHAEANTTNSAPVSTVLQNLDSGTEDDAVLQNLVSTANDARDDESHNDTNAKDNVLEGDAVLQNLMPIEDDTKDDESNHDTDAEDNEVEGEDDNKENERDTLDEDLIQMKTLRSTTSTHDDWLHRGPYLHDLPFHTYTEYVDRVRRPREPPPSQQLFEFEAHYALSRSYCQTITTPARVPVLEALKFVAPGSSKNEENELYKHLVASLTRCTCTDGCADPMLMKPFLLPIGSAGKSARWSFRLSWKARRAELEVLARRGEKKIERAMRIACIKDTTLVRGWLPTPSGHHTLLRVTLAQMTHQKYNVIGLDAWTKLLEYLGVANTHDDQLTLGEFAALRTRRLVQNLDMMAVARTVQLGDKKHSGEEHDNEIDADSNHNAPNMQSEFMGGGNDLEDECEISADELKRRPSHLANMTLETIKSILQRDDEIEAAKKPGRHRDADMQMKAFADHFGEEFTAPLPPISAEEVTARPRLLGLHPAQAIAHQTAVRNAMKKDQEDLKAAKEKKQENDDDPITILAALDNLQRQEEAEATCIMRPLPELMQGPKHIAECIMKEQSLKGRTLNDEQKLLFGLWVDCLQQAWLCRPNPEKPELPLDVWLFDMIIDGGGGCGKTMLINFFFVPLCRAFFGPAGVVLTAPSNKAARLIHGKTFHSLLGFTPDSSLRTSALALTTQKRIKLERTFLPMGAFLKDEFSMLPGQMNHAAALLATYARESEFRLRREDYAKPRERAGRAPVMLDAGDHLQLPPVPKKNSLLAPLERTSQEHRVGAGIFRNAHYVFQMQQMMRFKDNVLVRILHTMRTPGGKALCTSDWQALLDTEDQCGAAKPTAWTEWYHTCYVWSVVTMAAFMQARQSARQQKKCLVYLQAVDDIQNFQASATFTQSLHRSLLQVPSLTKTKRLPGFGFVHIGMEVRLTTTLEIPWAVQDATGTVLDIQTDRDYREDMPEIRLEELPIAVVIRLHNCEHVFLPSNCASCAYFNPSCDACKDKKDGLKGIFAVEPITRSWRYDGPELDGQFINIKRSQIPLGPAKILPLYGMQGMTAEPGLVAHWVLPPRLEHDIKWLICYVILSRVPSLKQLVSIGLSSKIREIIEGGPPEGLVQCFNTLFADKIKETKVAALEAKHRLGW